MSSQGNPSAAATPPAGAPLWSDLDLPLQAAIGAGVLGCVVAFAFNPQLFYYSYLAAYTFTLTLVLGLMFFCLVTHVFDAGWSIVVRRPAEQSLAAIPLLFFLFIPIVVGMSTGKLHSWVGAGHHLADEKKLFDEMEKAGKGVRVGYGEKLLPVGELFLTKEQKTELAADKKLPEKERRGVKLTDEQVEEKRMEIESGIHLMHAKESWLNLPFFLLRIGIYFGAWYVLAQFLRGNSLGQDADGDPQRSLNLRRYSTVGILVYAITVTFFSWDVLMSLDFKWFSTIFGVYVFAGGFVAGCALLAVFVSLNLDGVYKGLVPVDRVHDLGKLMFAFSVFWAYIAFSQFFLIWYANIPEETVWFRFRWVGDWPVISSVMPALRFVLPFVVLLAAFMKRNPRVLIATGVLMLAAHYLDHFWLVMPTFRHEKIFDASLLADVAALLAVGGGTAYAVLQALRSAPLHPLKDPRLPEATADGHHHGHGPAGRAAHAAAVH
jgi:hypothetical protein